MVHMVYVHNDTERLTSRIILEGGDGMRHCCGGTYSLAGPGPNNCRFSGFTVPAIFCICNVLAAIPPRTAPPNVRSTFPAQQLEIASFFLHCAVWYCGAAVKPVIQVRREGAD
jgi:hypothetical protein